jgi:transposase
MTNQLSHANLFSDLSNVTLRRVFNTDQGWIMEAHGQNSAVCPGCQSISRSRHSRYWRSLKDLPVQGTQVMLRLHLGRWRCRNAGCQRRIFTERLPKVCAPYTQQTTRTSEIIAAMGHALGGRPGERLMRRLGMPVSADTLIRQVKRAAHLSALSQVRVLGVDDWAWCKGQTFGTILVDLERSQVEDLLPTRSADSLGEWLAQHPEITTVSRDRQGVYAEGALRVAPEAVQVADRFHLVLNLTQAVERELAVNRRQLRIASSSASALPPSPTTEEVKSRSEPIRVRSSVMEHQMEVARQRRQQKLELFRTIKQIRGAGMKVNQIARQLGLCRRRIDKWIQFDELPERSRMQPRPGMAESFRDYLGQRWQAGCRHGRTLLAEIRKLGYVGCYSGLAKFLSPWRQPKAETRRPNSAFPEASQLEATTSTGSRQLSPQVAAALLSKVRAELTSQQAQIVDTLKRRCPGFAVMRKLVLSFRAILRGGKVTTLHRWMEEARKTGIHSLVRFVRTLKQDLSAVEAAVSEPWSNGPVEGQLNRLKMLKRQMYGRAGIELLRARLLPEPAFRRARAGVRLRRALYLSSAKGALPRRTEAISAHVCQISPKGLEFDRSLGFPLPRLSRSCSPASNR